MPLSRALLGIAIVMLAVIIAHPVAGQLRNIGVPLNP
jgi:hypothetical protein